MPKAVHKCRRISCRRFGGLEVNTCTKKKRNTHVYTYKGAIPLKSHLDWSVNMVSPKKTPKVIMSACITIFWSYSVTGSKTLMRQETRKILELFTYGTHEVGLHQCKKRKQAIIQWSWSCLPHQSKQDTDRAEHWSVQQPRASTIEFTMHPFCKKREMDLLCLDVLLHGGIVHVNCWHDHSSKNLCCQDWVDLPYKC